ncbi:MAG: sulfatase-like hydrolase/transferase [Ignavibacteriales bacterium]|nr:sulfatase-like hydrolase/transferase [Ignavibacteriales bacterium]
MKNTKIYCSTYKNKLMNFLFLGMLFLTACSKKQNNAHEKPNIIFILVDDLGYGDLSCLGANDLITPNIDNISKNGITFNSFYANCPVCSPSRASLLTGKYPDNVGVPGVIRQEEKDSWGYLNENTTTLPQILNELDYHTAMIGKWHLGYEKPNIPNYRGFQHFKGFLGDMMDDYWTHLRGGVNWMRDNMDEIDPRGHATDVFTNWAIEYIKTREKEENPFFLYLAYNAPHFPIQPPDDWLSKVKQREKNITEKRAKNIALIEHLDFCIGKLLQTLKETRLDENTLVIFTSDNGGALRYAQSNGELRGDKQEMFEGGIRVPMFAMWNGKIVPGTVTNNLGMLMDMFPTICEIAGKDSLNTIDGISLLPTLFGKNQTTDDRYLFWVRREGWHYGGQAYYAARYKNYKILQNSAYEPFQFFNIHEDEFEKYPLDIADDENYKNLRNALKEHIRLSGKVAWQK